MGNITTACGLQNSRYCGALSSADSLNFTISPPCVPSCRHDTHLVLAVCPEVVEHMHAHTEVI